MKTRLTWLAAIIGWLLVAGGVIHYATGFGNASTPHRPRTASPTRRQPLGLGYGERNLGIAYGTTPKQVLQQLGSPTKKHAGCWLYRGQVGKIRGRHSGSYVDAMKFCLSEGSAGGWAVTQIFSYYVKHTIVKRDPVTHRISSKRTFPARWGPPLTFMKVPDWYLQQNS